MSRFFGRGVELRIGTSINPQTTIMGPCRIWRDLRVEFEVEKSTSKKANTATIKLYNPDPSSIALIQQGNMVQLFAGYMVAPPLLPLLFTGSIATRGVRVRKKAKQTVTVEYQEVDTVVTIEAGDAHLALKCIRLSIGFAAGTDNNAMLSRVRASLGLGQGKGLPTLPPKVYAEEVILEGTVGTILDKLCGDVACTWSIQDGNLQLLLAGQPTIAQAVLLSPDTGLIGSPEANDKGVNLRSLLNPDIRPGGLVSVVSRMVTGFFKAKVVKHKGDSHGQDWVTEIEAVPVG